MTNHNQNLSSVIKLFFVTTVVLFSVVCVQSQRRTKLNCYESTTIIQPQFSDETRRDMEARLAEAKAQFDKNPKDADAIIWLGRRTAYLGNYKEAIEIYTRGISIHPNDARLYRHRGHRFITLRCFNDAIVDFERAAKLIKGKQDEIEPDGQPNAKNIPTSTLQSNIWYHLGLAYYLKGNFKKALNAYRECEKVSKNPDMLVATTHWLYMTLRRLNRNAEAKKVLAPITNNMNIIENDAYYTLLKMYQGKITPEKILEDAQKSGSSLNNASVGYGVGNWYFYNRQKEKAVDVFKQITSGNQWSSFGFIAAEIELKTKQK
jgi:tetratricopeptide (TPR) repeat protein